MLIRIVYIFLIVQLSFASEVFSQNLVPNPDFEFYSSCPSSISQLVLAFPWQTASINGTSDYFNACYPGITGGLQNGWPNGVPDNMLGTQTALSGQGYAGFFTYSITVPDYREYLQSPLSSTLIEGKKYEVEFYVSLATLDGDSVETIPMGLIGMYLGTDGDIANTQLAYAIDYVEPQIIADSVVLVHDWVKISGVFYAEGGENQITIGCFTNDAEISWGGNSNFGKSYYYIEDVSIHELPNEAQINIEMPNVFTPNMDGNNDVFAAVKSNLNFFNKWNELKVFNRWGNVVFQGDIETNLWDGKYNELECNEGVYFWQLLYEDIGGEIVLLSGSVTLLW